MARIRTIKPEFWSDDKIARLDWFTRCLFIALWNFADDEGRGRAIPKELNGFCFPLNDVKDAQVKAGLVTLAEAGMLTLYVADGIDLYAVTHWDRHQCVNRPTPSRLPEPPAFEAEVNTHGVLTEHSVSLQGQEVGSRKLEVGSRKRAREVRAAPPTPAECTAYGTTIGLAPDDCVRFHDYHTSKGWIVGRTAMLDWQASMRTWRRNGTTQAPNNGHQPSLITVDDLMAARGVPTDG